MNKFQELEFINTIKNRFVSKNSKLKRWIGDDAAVINLGTDKDILITTDLMAEDIHFSSDYFEPEDIGWRILSANLSDIAAMGGTPLFFTFSIAVAPHLKKGDFLDRMLNGIHECATNFSVELIGGDTSSSQDSLFIDLTMIGECEKDKSILRNGASPGDKVFISGDPGYSRAGLELFLSGWRLENNRPVSPTPTPPSENQKNLGLKAMTTHLRPVPLLSTGQVLSFSGVATSMIDTSDGISTDIMHICEESGVGAIIDYSSFDESLFKPLKNTVSAYKPKDWILNGGEDFLLMFTVIPDSVNQLNDTFNRHQLKKPMEIGEITTQTGIVQIKEKNGSIRELNPSGWQHT